MPQQLNGKSEWVTDINQDPKESMKDVKLFIECQKDFLYPCTLCGELVKYSEAHEHVTKTCNKKNTVI